jgi:hypothetical protein
MVEFDDDLRVRLDEQAGHPTLVTCAQDDPIPNAIDDEQSLCLTLQLSPGALDVLRANDRVRFRGEAVFSPDLPQAPPSYTPAAEQSTAATAAWAILSAFCTPRTDGPAQQLDGTLAIARLSAQDFAGRVEMNVDGQLGGSGCQQSAGPAELAFSFDVDR